MSEWTRLRIWAEIPPGKPGALIPQPPARNVHDPRAEQQREVYERSGFAQQGEGMDQQWIEMLSLKDGAQYQPMRAGDPVGPLPERLTRTSDREWWPDELPMLQKHATEILAAYDFPIDVMVPGAVLWAWRPSSTGPMLYWRRPPAPGISPDKATLGLGDADQRCQFPDLDVHPRCRDVWPAAPGHSWSPLQWALMVRRLAHQREWSLGLISRNGSAEDALKQSEAVAFGLGVQLGLDEGLRRNRQRGKQGRWQFPTLAEARELRSRDPALGQMKLARALIDWAEASGVRSIPPADELKKYIGRWEAGGLLERSAHRFRKGGG